MRGVSQGAMTIVAASLVVALLAIGAASLMLWVSTPDIDVGQLLDHVRPYLPLQFG